MTSEEQELHDTKEIERSTLSPDLGHHSIPSSLAEVDLAALTHPGFVRANNEDHYVAVRMHRSLETILTNLTDLVVPERFDETATAWSSPTEWAAWQPVKWPAASPY